MMLTEDENESLYKLDTVYSYRIVFVVVCTKDVYCFF